MNKFYFIFLIAIMISSCSVDEKKSFDNNYQMSGELETTNKEILRNSILELTELSKELFKQDNIREELYFLSNSTYYKDHFIPLKELLNYQNSVFYKNTQIDERLIGSYAISFKNEMERNSTKYPNLFYIIKTKSISNANSRNIEPCNEVYSIEEFYNVAEVSYYVPYAENYINDENYNPTLVPSVSDADSGLGFEPSTDSYIDVVTDDDYAESTPTYLIMPLDPCDVWSGGGGNDNDTDDSNQYTGDCETIKTGEYIRQVFIGHAKINNKHQYDHWISFTGNGGGSEIQIMRVGSAEHIDFDGENITVTSPDDHITKDFSRADIRYGRDKWLGAIWDANWECNDFTHEQLLFIWEKDNTEDIDFEFSGIEFQDSTLIGEVNFNYQVRTQDEIIRQFKREETEFFATNLLDQGCGCKNGGYSFSDRCWSWYDCGTNFKYTMPHRWVEAD